MGMEFWRRTRGFHSTFCPSWKSVKFSAGNCYNTIPILQVCHIWFKIGRYQQCLFVSTNCAIVQKTTECGVVHFLPSEAVIIGASLRAAKWGRQKTGEGAGGAGQVEPSWRFWRRQCIVAQRRKPTENTAKSTWHRNLKPEPVSCTTYCSFNIGPTLDLRKCKVWASLQSCGRPDLVEDGAVSLLRSSLRIHILLVWHNSYVQSKNSIVWF